MGDPRLGAVDLVDAALAHGTRPQAAEIGAGIGLGEDGGRQDLARGDARQVFLLLLRRAAEADELGGDLGAGAERTDADIGARQLLRDDAHGELAETEAAGALGHGEAEHAERRHLLDHGERDQLVLEMPVMSEGRDALGAEAPELVAHHVERLLAKREMAEIAAVERILQQLGEPGARRLAVAGAREERNLGPAEGVEVVIAEA